MDLCPTAGNVQQREEPGFDMLPHIFLIYLDSEISHTVLCVTID